MALFASCSTGFCRDGPQCRGRSWRKLLFLVLFAATTCNFAIRYYATGFSQLQDARLMTTYTNGRLGNQMGSYAVLYGLAKLNGYSPYIPESMHKILSPFFRLTIPVMNETVKNLPWTNLNKHDWMSDEYLNLKPRLVRMYGYFCSWTFFHQYRSEILQEFTFHDHIRERAQSTLAMLKGNRKNPTYVGVHVRRGDYIRVMREVYHGVVGDKTYLEKAMVYFRSKYKEPVFVVASNGMQWCRENIDTTRGDVYFAGDSDTSSPGSDLALLAHCNHTIMTIGTFGFWAAYLAGGETIYLQNYTLPDSRWRKIFKPEANYLPEWIGISANLSSLHQSKRLGINDTQKSSETSGT